MAKAKKSLKTGNSGRKSGKKTARIAQDATAKAPTGEGIKNSGAQRKGGRPTIYSQDLADEFCSRIADGASERTVCAAEDMPDRRTIQRWCEANEEFCRQYARAREERGWTLAEQALEIADTPVIGEIQTAKMGKDGPYTEIRRADMVEHRRLQVDTRRWFCSKLDPKRLSERVKAEHTGEGGAPIQIQIIPPDYDKLQELAAKYAAARKPG